VAKYFYAILRPTQQTEKLTLRIERDSKYVINITLFHFIRETLQLKRVDIAFGLFALTACGDIENSTALAATYYVDYSSGSNIYAGTSAQTPWKHSPGDPNATNRPANTRLQPGDKVLFRGGVPYRGSFKLLSSGTSSAPITFSGSGFGNGLGIIDGSEAVRSVRPCSSSADCGGSSNWSSLHRIDFDVQSIKRVTVFGKSAPYWSSQIPNANNPFYADSIADYLDTPLSSLPELRSGRLRSSELALAAASGGTLELALWVIPNFVVRVPVLGVEGNILRFDPSGLNFQTTRDGKVALNGSFAGLAVIGSFLVLQPGVVVARLRAEDSLATISIGTGRMGINANGQSHIRINAIHFRNLSGSANVQGDGRAFSSTSPGTTDIEMKGNLMGPAFLENGNSGLIRVIHGRNMRFVSNRIENISSGTVFSMGGLTARDLLIEGNLIQKIGRSGINLFSVDGAIVRGNILANLRGIHGNGISIYMENKRIIVDRNCIVNTSRPITFHGNSQPNAINDIRISNNILVSSGEGQSAVNSWGRDTNTVNISNNILVGPRHGIALNSTDLHVSLAGNITSGILISGKAGNGWTMSNNTEDFTFERALDGEFSENSCSIPGNGLNLVVHRLPS